jgi:hypothetical protein
MKCGPFAFGRRSLGHAAEPPQFSRRPFAAGGEFRISAVRKAVGPADQARKASLPYFLYALQPSLTRIPFQAPVSSSKASAERF